MPATLPTRRAFIAQAGATLAGLGAALNLGICTGAAAQAIAQPGAEPLRILCSGPPGSIPDLIARRVAEQLAAGLSRHVLVDNRPGAAGQIAVAALKRAAGDGTTMLLAQGAIAAVYPYLYPRLAYDPAVDLAPVSLAGEMTLALAVGPSVPDAVTDVRGLVAWMQRTPAQANVGSPGTGTLPHLLEAMLTRDAGAPWQHVAYPGGPPAIADQVGS